MTVPNGEPGINPPDFGVTNDGTIPNLPARSQTVAENFYKARVQDSASWQASSPIFTNVVNALIGAVFDAIADAVGTIPIVGGALEDIIEGFADWLLETSNTATTAQATADSKSKVTKGSSAPSSPAVSDIWIDTTGGTNTYKVWNGSAWVVTTDQIAIDAANDAATAQGTADSAQQTGVDNSAAISELQSTLSGEVGGSGYTYAYPFDGSSLDADWTTYDPNGTGTQVGGGQVEPDDNATGNIFHLFETALPGDDFETSFTLGDNNSHGTECTGLCFASDNTMTDFARIYTFDNEIYLGRSTRPSSSSNSITTYDWASNSSQSFTPGKTCRVRKVGTNYKVWVGTALVFNHTNSAGDPGGVKTTGASYRHCGLQQEYDGTIFHGRSAGVAHFTVADYTAPTIVGTGWRIIRTNTGNATGATWSTTGSPFGATFDTTDVANGVTVSDQSVGRVQVTKAGFYSVSVGVEFSSGAAQASTCVGVMTGTTIGSLTVVARGAPSAVDPPSASVTGTSGFASSHDHAAGSYAVNPSGGSIGAAGGFVVYANANDYIQVCGIGGGSSVAVRGSADGSKCYFTGAYMGTQ